MSKILDWIKSHKALTVLIAAAVFLLPLVCVHIAYKINAVSPFFVSTWDSGNLITYIAGFEAFLGSLFLGGVAVYQNKKANELNVRMLENEEKHRKFERTPCVQISPRKVTIQTITNVLNHPGPIYYYKDYRELGNYPSDYWDKEYFLFSWEVKNAASKQIRVTLNKLELKMPKQQETLIFTKNWMNLSLEMPYIVPQNSIDIGFIIDIETMEPKNNLEGDLVLEILNDVNEVYILSLVFLIIHNTETGFFIHILSEELESK